MAELTGGNEDLMLLQSSNWTVWSLTTIKLDNSWFTLTLFFFFLIEIELLYKGSKESDMTQ